MDKLKQFIHNNREGFDAEELPAGHITRFEKKLYNKRNIGKIYCLYALAVAASVAVLVMLTLPFYGSKHQKLPVASCTIANDIDNLQLYYTMQINEVVRQIEAFEPGKMTQAKELILQETARIQATNILFETAVVPTLPCNDQALYAMTQYYDTSLQSLSFMLRQMQQVRDIN